MTTPVPSTAPTGFRTRVRHLGEPIALFLGRLGLTPNALTILGFLITVAGAALAAAGLWLLAGIVVFLGGAFDMFDGALARATGKASKVGAFLDSVFDRWGESVVYIGVVIGCLNAGFPLGAGLAAAAMSEAFLVSYTRARAESLGLSTGSGMAAVGLAPREVRLVILSLGLLIAGLAGGVQPSAVVSSGPGFSIVAWGTLSNASTGAQVLAAALGLIAILATITVIQRIIHVTKQAATSDGK
ncbi:MAG TPA: CDP-alcohol phosphatidyltransferase family protein [Candidatus Limnocylindrales bacterium]|nr:CDP-alcohol phosphatidyltransferase family protein [Candidatus Limnocylindrales bacterium]